MEITTGFRSVLSAPIIYEIFQSLMRDKNLYNEIITLINEVKSPNVLDIGCGSADILKDLSVEKYVGFDISQRYIDLAKKTHEGNTKSTFIANEFSSETALTLGNYNVVLFKGLMHHLADEEVASLIKQVKKVCAKGALVITVDPVFIRRQNLISRLLVSMDRGQNVRDLDGYSTILSENLKIIISSHRSQKFIPYDRCFFVCEVE